MAVADRELSYLSDIISNPERLAALFAGDTQGNETSRSIDGSGNVSSPGSLLYLELHHLASAPNWKANKVKIDKICSNQVFVDYLRRLHDIPGTVLINNLNLHESGTTSFIFSVDMVNLPRCALKTVHVQYFSIEEVRIATRTYKERFNRYTDYSPTIFDSSDTWILMEFIDGVRLSDYLQALREKHSFMSREYFFDISILLTSLLTALGYYERQVPSIVHGDLTPLNILVQDKGNGAISIKLIDFGPNYVLRDRVVTRRAFADAFARTEIFVAPEVLTGHEEPTVLTDIYSLGKIILETLSAVPLRQEEVGIRLRAIWENPATVGLAKIVEDLIDDGPNKRLLMIPGVKPGRVYPTISATLQETIRIYNDLASEAGSNKPPESPSWFIWKPDVWSSIKKLYRISYTTERHYTVAGKELFLSSTVNALFQATIVFAFIVYTLADIKNAWFPGWSLPFVDELISWVLTAPKDFQIGEVWDNLSGRLVALTFGLVASRYYANLFANIKVTAKNDPGRYSTNLFLRLNCLSYFLPIMAAIVWNPLWWPWCAFIGSLFPAIANWFSWRSAKFGAERARESFSLSGYYDSEFFLNYFRESWILMGSYSVGIGAIGLALQQGWAVDEKIYAYAVCITNMAKIYRNNCGIEAPYVSGNLARLFYASHRSEMHRSSDSLVRAL